MTDARLAAFLAIARRAIIMFLGGLEDFMGVPRSITPRRERRGA